MGLGAAVSREDELMSREDCAVNVWCHVWLRVWVLQLTGRAQNYKQVYLQGAQHKESGALVRAPCHLEIRTQAAQGRRGGCTG